MTFYNGCAKRKHVLGHTSAQISMHIRAVWSGLSLSSNRSMGYYRMYGWTAKTRMILCTCAVSSEPAHFAHFRNHFCAWTRSIWPSECLSFLDIQSTLVISNSKGISVILRDISISTYQICRIEETIIRLSTFNKYICNWTLEISDILKILWKRGEIALFHNIFYMLLDFHV